jgi:ATP/maltotriose-dependent transcriptional regulator MalT
VYAQHGICPAGYGKTTLLGEWLASISKHGWSSAWLTLDTDDNDPLRFWGYLTDALSSVNPQWQLDLPKPGETSAGEIDRQLIDSWINQIDPTGVIQPDS